VASMIPPYDHTILIGGAGKAYRRLGGHIGRREKEAFARVERTHIAEACLGRRILFPCRPVGRRLRAEQRRFTRRPRLCLKGACTVVGLTPNSSLGHAFSAAQLVYSGADACFKPADRAPNLMRDDAVIYPRFSMSLPIAAYRAAQGKGTKL
jgi:hypothetical protein